MEGREDGEKGREGILICNGLIMEKVEFVKKNFMPGPTDNNTGPNSIEEYIYDDVTM